MATNLSEWYQNILNKIPALPYPALLDAGRIATRKFCKETWLWTYTFDLIDVEADTSEYEIDVPEALYAELEAIPKDGVRYKEDGEDEEQFSNLNCTSEQELDDTWGGGWRYKTSPIPSNFYVPVSTKAVNLYPIPEDDSSEGLEVTGILKPSRSCTSVPDFLYDDHEKTIEYGILEELFSRDGMPWFNAGRASEFGMKFKAGYNTAKGQRFTGKTNKSQNIKIPFF